MGGGGGSAAGEIITAIANSPLANSIAASINSRNAVRRGSGGDTNSEGQIRARAIALQERQLRVAEQELAQREQKLMGGDEEEHSADVEPHPPERTQRQGAQPQKPPALPPEIATYTNALVLAGDEGELVGAVVELVMYISEVENWDRIGYAILQMAASGNKELGLQYFSALFDGLAGTQLITNELHAKALGAVDKNWDLIVQHVQANLEEMQGQEPDDPEAMVQEAFDEANLDTLDTSGLGLDEDDDDIN
jgi:hypothetical protein